MLLLGIKNVSPQTLITDQLVNLGSVYRRYCRKNDCGIPTFSYDGTSVSLQHRGMYKITITAIVSGTVAGDVTLQLLENGTPITGALATETITTPTTELRTMSIDYYVLVDSDCVLGNLSTTIEALSLQNTGVGATITNIVTNVLKVS